VVPRADKVDRFSIVNAEGDVVTFKVPHMHVLLRIGDVVGIQDIGDVVSIQGTWPHSRSRPRHRDAQVRPGGRWRAGLRRASRPPRLRATPGPIRIKLR
jgi:hypothetical protein